MSKPTIICKNCGKEFIPKHWRPNDKREDHKVKYCSKECQNAGKRKGIVKECEICGKEFTIRPCELRKRKGLYCSYECSNSLKRNRVWRTCEYCGKVFEVKESLDRAKFCSIDCKNKGQVYLIGDLYRGLGAPPVYCEKWTPELRERVRLFFGHRCVLCGKSQDENISKNGMKMRLDCHHVNYRKDMCCDESVPKLLVALCRECHVKTNKDREYWERYITELIMLQYGGKCFFTKEEYLARL